MGNARRAERWVIASKDLMKTLRLIEAFGRTYLDDVYVNLPRHDYTVFTPSSNNLHDTPELDRALARLGEQPCSVQINFKRPAEDPFGIIREVQYNADVVHVKKLVTIELVVLGEDCEAMDQFFARARDALGSFISVHWPETAEDAEAHELLRGPASSTSPRSPAIPAPSTLVAVAGSAPATTKAGVVKSSDQTRTKTQERPRMDQQRKLDLLQQQIDTAQGGSPANFDEWRNKTGVVLRAVVGLDNPLNTDFNGISYSLSMWTERTPESAWIAAQAGGVREAIAILEAAKTEVELWEDTSEAPKLADLNPQEAPGRDIFVVHGRDEARENSVARTVSKLVGFEPVILHEQPNAGLTIIEKLEASANAAGYAIVIATGDDLGRLAGANSAAEQPRARQNVIFELGYFIGKLGRDRVALLFDPSVERPSDTDGIVYIPLDSHGGWKVKLANELQKADYSVDWSKLGS
ncbi:nucleotide-binding protein [Rhodococcus qingshengii]|uniref:Nucleotide-binding protein n=1 Tax=Rhodococcus qingshengii TaxID=334542 RepID=A0AAW6LKT6_RHOSG|nr:nucleotide-binding protein [Rhodococcus qingshengii]MDE8644705.1 nucleotide-binding protein [Rhodococcus qingshengii]